MSVRYEQARPLVEAGDRVEIVGFLYEGRVYPTLLDPATTVITADLG